MSARGLFVAAALAAAACSGPPDDDRRAVVPRLRVVPAAAPPCPGDGAHPARLLVVLGQSNAGSHAQAAGPGPEVRVLGDAGCRLVRDPLPNTTGDGASVWSAMVDRLDGDPATAGFVLAPLAVESTRIGDWTGDGTLRPHLEALLARVRASGLPVAAVLVQQGESDAMHSTPPARFLDGVLALRAALDAGGVRAPLVLARSTYCRGQASEALRAAIGTAAAREPRIVAGPDTDGLRDAMRVPVCHFSAAGRLEAARLWADSVARLEGR